MSCIILRDKFITNSFMRHDNLLNTSRSSADRFLYDRVENMQMLKSIW